MGFEEEVYQWAREFWPDVPETWGRCREYYYAEYAKWRQQQGGRAA